MKLLKIILIFSLVAVFVLPLGVFAVGSFSDETKGEEHIGNILEIEGIKPGEEFLKEAEEKGSLLKGGVFELPNPLGAKTFEEFISKLFKALEPIIGILAMFFIILAGFQFLTAQGNEDKIKKAKQTLYGTLIGTAIALGADILIRVITEILKTL